MAAPVRAATARPAPVKLQNQRSSEHSPDRGGACSLKTECKKCATRLAPLFFEVAQQTHPPLQFYFRFFRCEARAVCGSAKYLRYYITCSPAPNALLIASVLSLRIPDPQEPPPAADRCPQPNP